MSIEEKILKQRKEDKGYKKVKDRKKEPPKPQRKEETVKKTCGITGIPVSVKDEKTVKDRPEGLFSEKIEETQRMGAKPGQNREKPKKHYKSQAKRNFGINLKEKYGLVRCNYKLKQDVKCPGFMIVKNGQKTATCPDCGNRRWLNAGSKENKGEGKAPRVVSQSSNLKSLKRRLADVTSNK